jgi:predicted transcriptional regulator
MSTPLKTLDVIQTLMDAVQMFNLHHIHGAPVVDGSRLAGIVTMSDIAKAIGQGLPMTTGIDTVMTTDVVEASSDTLLFEVVGRFKERKIGRLVVVEKGKPVGILTQSDIIRVFPSL